MSSKKSVIIIVASLALLAFFWMLSSEDRKEISKEEIETIDNYRPGDLERSNNAVDEVSASLASLQAEASELFGREKWPDYIDLVQKVREGRIDLIAELWRLRRQCENKVSYEKCNALIRLTLKDNFPSTGQEEMLSMFDKYLHYESFLRDYKAVKDRKENLKILEEEQDKIFGHEQAGLLFGLTRANNRFQESASEYINETRGLKTPERMKKFEELRKKVFENYYDAVVEKEPAFQKYEREMVFQADEKKASNATLDAGEIAELREKYFGSEAAERMAKVDKQLEAEKGGIARYQAEEQRFLQNNGDLSGEEKAEKLKKLREELLGKEEAEAYQRRKLYEDYLKKSGK